ncbi:biotin-dependent carboxyltransferase family protein [Roseobacter sp. GAI101]|uniref:5-oxoprolinase subunit C family protein n=1 Tax=Roseobacter sp. (strain GAI101) TaxID=391589 RepID=UPI0001872488|nr:biotin-dependent carboxyltransferase family protein [Roseobacter sp. GAI101]EEB85832.1 allophanate hydrolase subunit 2 [Roseobacter sp. GAI101]
MTTTLTIVQAGPALTIQDLGRAGWLAQGLTKGGAADPVAIHEGAALLGQSPDLAAIEMTGTGGTFTADADIRIALTGASMAAKIDGDPIAWNAGHLLPAGAKLTIGGATSGTYGYLHIGGGIASDPVLGARATHLSAGLGAALKSGDSFPVGPDKGRETGMKLPRDTRFDGGVVRVVASMQTDRFAPEERERFIATQFARDPRANRMGVRMDHDGAGFHAEGGLTILSEVIVPGDIQITGDGAPFVLMGESQTTGGYPRIGTVIPRDLPRVAQAPAGTKITFEFVTLEQAITLETQHRRDVKALPGQLTALVRDPATIRNLMEYQLVGGAVSAKENPFEKDA